MCVLRCAGSLHSRQSGTPEGGCVGGATWHFDISSSNLASSIIYLNCFSNAWGFASPCCSRPITMKVLWFVQSVYLHNCFWNLNAHTSSGLQVDPSAYPAPGLSSGLSGADSCSSVWAPILDLNGLHFLLLWGYMWREVLSSRETDSKRVSQFVSIRQLVSVYVSLYCTVVTSIGSIILGFFQFTFQFNSFFF